MASRKMDMLWLKKPSIQVRLTAGCHGESAVRWLSPFESGKGRSQQIKPERGCVLPVLSTHTSGSIWNTILAEERAV